jgi:outer membrane immunogenic protein
MVAIEFPAGAADLEASPDSVQWRGFYVGGQLGGAWSESDWQFTNYNYWNTLGPNLVGTKFDQAASGVLGGGQVGFNYQAGAWVLGVEGSGAATDLSDTIVSSLFPTDRYVTKIDTLATVTGRLGYAQGNWLAYAKGGWAGADLQLRFYEVDTDVRSHGSTWVNGWTVGGGLEYALGPHLSLGVEYDYVGLDTGNWLLRCTGCGTGIDGGAPVMDGDINIQSVAARLNYRFGGL